MLFSSARMESAQSLVTKSEPDQPQRSAPASLRRSASTDNPHPKPDDPFHDRDSASTSEPVFIKSDVLGIREFTPAARIVRSKPVFSTGIFPSDSC